MQYIRYVLIEKISAAIVVFIVILDFKGISKIVLPEQNNIHIEEML